MQKVVKTKRQYKTFISIKNFVTFTDTLHLHIDSIRFCTMHMRHYIAHAQLSRLTERLHDNEMSILTLGRPQGTRPVVYLLVSSESIS